MGSSAETSVDLGVGPEEAVQAVEKVISENGHTLVESLPAEGVVRFTTKKTLFTWELETVARVSSDGNGSRVDITLDTTPGRPRAMLDGKKNLKAAQKLADQIRAAVK